MGKVFVVSTSDRQVFKRCRRKWDLSNRNRQSLQPISAVVAGPLWLGTGFHFAMEDYYGYNEFKSPVKAFEAFVKSHRRSELPEGYDELTDLATGMLQYYMNHWLPQHGEAFETLWVDDIPQVEVNVRIPLDIAPPPGYDAVEYSITFDRVAIDEYDRIIIVDYKTTGKAYEVGRLEQDPQVSSYFWAGQLLYGRAIEGACWMEFLKAVPHPPEVLKSGELSQNKQQYTTASIYRETLMEYYGKIPQSYVPFLNYLASLETPEGDRYVKREFVYRNADFARNVERQIFEEIYDMIDPNIRIYPNPTRDCQWDCNYRPISLAMDDGSDYEYMIQSEFERWEGEGYKSNQWRQRLQYPEALEVTTS